MTIELSVDFPVNVSTLYSAWLDSDQHAAMTGGEASVSDKEGDSFTAWDEYISGKNIELIPNTKIRQTWRTTDFPETQPDSELVLDFIPTENGTRLLLKHTGLSKTDGQYESGWEEHYFTPMAEYFASLS
ncbi:MAG: SRPBCC domain-containing protein [Fluviicola sp.]|nr:SRPBCC domain-containing protein [Fluviicola sp.]